MFHKLIQYILLWNSPIPKKSGLFRSPNYIAQDPRRVYIDEILAAVPGIARPNEFFSRYAVEHIASLEYSQKSIPCCVAEAGSRVAGTLEYKEKNSLRKPSVQALMAYIKSRIERNTREGAYLESSPKALIKWGSPFEREFASDYSLDWKEFIKDVRIPIEIEKRGYRLKIKGYAFVHDNFNSIKDGIWNGEGNIVQGGVRLSREGWRKGDVKKPEASEKTTGHSIDYIGYDKSNIYAVNSWREDWGLTLYLKKVIIDKNNYYYKIGDPSGTNIAIKGIARLGPDYNDPEFLHEGYTFMDLPDEVALKTKMYQLIRDPNNSKEVYAVDNSKRHHVVNKFSLIQGALLNHWIYKEGDSIPVMDPKQWNFLVEGTEILFLPPDNATIEF